MDKLRSQDDQLVSDLVRRETCYLKTAESQNALAAPWIPFMTEEELAQILEPVMLSDISEDATTREVSEALCIALRHKWTDIQLREPVLKLLPRMRQLSETFHLDALDDLLLEMVSAPLPLGYDAVLQAQCSTAAQLATSAEQKWPLRQSATSPEASPPVDFSADLPMLSPHNCKLFAATVYCSSRVIPRVVSMLSETVDDLPLELSVSLLHAIFDVSAVQARDTQLSSYLARLAAWFPRVLKWLCSSSASPSVQSLCADCLTSMVECLPDERQKWSKLIVERLGKLSSWPPPAFVHLVHGLVVTHSDPFQRAGAAMFNYMLRWLTRWFPDHDTEDSAQTESIKISSSSSCCFLRVIDILRTGRLVPHVDVELQFVDPYMISAIQRRLGSPELMDLASAIVNHVNLKVRSLSSVCTLLTSEIAC